jgi:hypothetical protein
LVYKVIPKSLGFRSKDKMRPGYELINFVLDGTWASGASLHLHKSAKAHTPEPQLFRGPSGLITGPYSGFLSICPPEGLDLGIFPSPSSETKEQKSLLLKFNPGKLVLQLTC